jgi:hypothetical protein
MARGRNAQSIALLLGLVDVRDTTSLVIAGQYRHKVRERAHEFMQRRDLISLSAHHR